ncbi:MAG: BadF/BadG/BcrA/BcrD ATPase family protein [Granulosicoccus sp.]
MIVVAVDGGASRCRMAAFNAGGEVLARVSINEHASLSLGVSAAWQHIETGLRKLGRSLQKDQQWLPDRLMLGLAGSLQERRRHDFLRLLPPSLPCTLVTDGHAQLLGASAGLPGICLAVGTGSVLHWMGCDGNSHMVGGWGFPVGDEGSGAWLGMRLLQIYIGHKDGRTEESTLICAVESRVGSSVSSIQQWTTQTQSSVLAQLAPLVVEHAARGDMLAKRLLEEAADHCLALIALAPADLPVYIVGGIGEQLSPRLGEVLGNRIAKAHGDALRGLWQLSRQAQ